MLKNGKKYSNQTYRTHLAETKVVSRQKWMTKTKKGDKTVRKIDQKNIK